MPTGVAGQLPDNLSTYMKIGRSQRPGPVTGVMECLSFSQAAIGATAGIHERAVVRIPSPFRVFAITWYSRAQTTSPDLNVVTMPAADPYGTVVTNIKVLFDIAADPDGILRSSALGDKLLNEDGSEPFLAIRLGMASSTLTDFCCTVWYMRMGHINSDPVND